MEVIEPLFVRHRKRNFTMGRMENRTLTLEASIGFDRPL
jgi:hypothetical protein